MSKTHYAGIDIGSNAVRLLIKCVNPDGAVEPLSKVQLVRVPLRLGEDAFVKGKISKKKRSQLLSLMRAYKELLEIYEVDEYRACATSAMRDAVNHQELTEEIFASTGIRIEVIGGREEAELIYSNLVESIKPSQADYFLFVDVGGGSTECNLVQGKELLESHSFNIGTIRQLSGMIRSKDMDNYLQYIEHIKERYGKVYVVGSGGNINKLLRLGTSSESEKINLLPTADLRRITEMLKLYTPEERMIKFHLKPDRADVIVPAAEIFLSVCERLEASDIIVPTKGLADGIIDSIYQKHLNTGLWY